jgi:hypothetical protein
MISFTALLMAFIKSHCFLNKKSAIDKSTAVFGLN